MHFLELRIMFLYSIICFEVHRMLSRLNLYRSCGLGYLVLSSPSWNRQRWTVYHLEHQSASWKAVWVEYSGFEYFNAAGIGVSFILMYDNAKPHMD